MEKRSPGEGWEIHDNYVEHDYGWHPDFYHVGNFPDSSSSEEDTSEESSEENSSEEFFAKETVISEVLSHPHIKDEVTVPHITTLPPPITTDTRKSNKNMTTADKRLKRQVVTNTPVILTSAMNSMTTGVPSTTAMALEAKVTTAKTPVSTTTTTTTTTTTGKAVHPLLRSKIDPCDLLCTKFELEPICATNGICIHEFPNQCIMDGYNCKHPKEKFTATKDDRCLMHWLEQCKDSDLI
uniref:Kazal-like domain-containing protein n=1 Tax=Musca domestica TaxID=7370 RepID=A0A1I8ML90_MUSDO